MNTDIELRHLKLMAILGQSQTMTAAAEKLRLTQSALSHQLKDAEAKIGTPLFFRKNRKLTMTPAGRQLLTLSQEILRSLDSGVKAIRANAHIENMTLRIATECYTCYHWLPPVFKEYTEQFPEVKLEVVAKHSNSPIAALQKGKLDLVITSDEIKGSGLHIEPLFSDELIAVLPPTHPLAAKRHLDPKDFLDQTVIIYNVPEEESTLLSALLKPVGVKPSRVIRMDLTEGILELSKAGLGIGFLAHWAAARFLEQGSLVARPVGKTGYTRTWKAVTTKELGAMFHMKEFMVLLKEELAD